ncbi:MAG: 4-hydroxy-tetrahydrodipicolinate synthase [Haliscomenobacteraceae bacterium CHB4]|nr:4-hydroxy-tetrahydrodipicolinate synthase [Saprospiraceae bacterium]MCE7926090.1 4-hydroxy-tetrahydrodipicolinate synthase [Haliscomenobacteraceae bacterium CHB4]
MNPHERFRGTGVALVTPFKNGAIDWEDLEKIIEHVIAGGVEFLVSLGTTGESVTLSDDEQRQVLDFTIKVNRGRLPLVAGVFGGNNTAAMVEKIQNFDFEGIDALLSSNPAYNKPGQEGIFKHYMELAEVSPRPIIIYNVPSRTASNMNAETTLRLANASDKFLGVKEASDDIYQIMKIIKGKPKNFLMLSGDDFITLPLIAAGGDGVISVIANTTPRPFTDMVRAALRQDMPTAQQLNMKLLELYKLLFIEGNPVGVKAALELQGLCSREVRLPLVPMTEQGVHLVMAEMEKVLG